MSKSIKYLLLIILIFVANASFSRLSAQEIKVDKEAIEKIEVPEDDIQSYKDNPDFDYELKKQEENIFSRFFSWIKRKLYKLLSKIFNWLFGHELSSRYLKYFIKSLPYLAVIIFIYLVFRFMLGIDLIRMGKNQKMQLNQVDLSDDERIMQEEDLDQLIAQAIKDKDYRLAVRYHYLKVLKYLIENGFIDWHPEKTNRDYLNDMRSHNLSTAFRNLTFIYDYIWYGNFSPNHKEFKEIQSDFKAFY